MVHSDLFYKDQPGYCFESKPKRANGGNKDPKKREDGVLDQSGSSRDAKNVWNLYGFKG